MPILPRISSFWRNLFHESRVERDLNEEVGSYLQMLTEEKIKSGMRPEAGLRAAKIELGGSDQVKEQVREIRSGFFLETLLQDLRYGLRQLRRNPGFAAVAVITLALGIGANTAIFTVVNGVLLRPLPLPHPERVLRLWHGSTKNKDSMGSVSFPNFKDWERQNTVFEGLSLYSDASFNLMGKGGPERVSGAFVSANYFAITGVGPTIGRAFLPGEDEAGHNGVAVISAVLWRNRFGNDPNILGKTIFLNQKPVAVVGVMPAWFHFPSEDSEVWAPLVPGPDEAASRGMNMFEAIGRLKAGVGFAQARAQMEAIATRLAHMYPDSNGDQDIVMKPLQEAMVGGVRQDLMVLMVAVLLVFLIACTNVVNLLLARTAARQREIAVRMAVGSGRGRLLQQFLAENWIVAVAGAGLGSILFT